MSLLDVRASGLLLHPSSLPGPHGIGDFGASARSFADQLSAADQTWWQILPLGPPAVVDSPYQATSAFAGNPLLISLDGLREMGLLEASEIPESRPVHVADFGYAFEQKWSALERAKPRFFADPGRVAALDVFRHEMSAWLPDFALFSALKHRFGGAAWMSWPSELRDRHHEALEAVRREVSDRIQLAEMAQYLFHIQWRSLVDYAHSKGVRIMGDVPIFVAGDSADVWANRRVFRLDAEGQPIVVAGVPPDYFSEDGQLWGNPHYDWDYLRSHGFDWWVRRFAHTFKWVDAVRIDHFIGFVRAWEVRFGAKHARQGEWRPGPGADLFHALKGALGDVAILAEDLGSVDEKVWALRDAFGFPGMKVLQFGFGADGRPNDHQPHTYTRATVAYTGTHDNDTAVGWYQNLQAESAVSPEAPRSSKARSPADARATLENVQAFVRTDGTEVHWDMMHALLGSVANTVVFPVQDLLGLGSEHRMNTPGTTEGNWRFRMPESGIPDASLARLARLTRLFGRGRKS